MIKERRWVNLLRKISRFSKIKKTENINNRSDNLCFADKNSNRCDVLNTKCCKKCSFRKTTEQYKKDRLKYRDKEMVYLAKHGITYRGD